MKRSLVVSLCETVAAADLQTETAAPSRKGLAAEDFVVRNLAQSCIPDALNILTHLGLEIANQAENLHLFNQICLQLSKFSIESNGAPYQIRSIEG